MKKTFVGASSLPRQTTLVLALGAALVGMLPTTVMASASLCVNGGHIFSLTQTWTGGDCSIVSGQGAVTNASFASSQMALFGTGSNMGTLTNSGTLSATNGHSGPASAFLMGQNTSAARFINAVGGTILGSITGYTAADSSDTIFAAGIDNKGSIIALDNYGQILGVITNTGVNTQSDPNNPQMLILNAVGIKNSNTGTIGTLTNGSGGTISGNSDGVSTDNNSDIQGTGIYNQGTIATIANAGRITGQYQAIQNVAGTIGAINNTGQIDSQFLAIINNAGTINTINNSGTITATYSGATGILNQSGGTIGTIINTGLMNSAIGILNQSSTIGLINNSSTIISSGTGPLQAVSNTDGGHIGTIINSGLISGPTTLPGSGTVAGIFNYSGTIDSINNSGTITASTNPNPSNASLVSAAIINDGRYDTTHNVSAYGMIGTLSNSGLISAANAILSGINSQINTIANSGTISGDIHLGADVVFTGGTNSTFGTLTGYGAGTSVIGLIANDSSSSNINFASGNILLNDNVSVFNGRTVSNTGATVKVNQNISINGNYQQSASGTLMIGVSNNAVAQGTIGSDLGYGRLVVTGDATVASGSSIVLQKNGSYTFAANQRFIVITATGTGTYNEGTLNYSISGVTGATFLGTNDSNNLVVKILSVPTVSTPSSGGLSTTPNASSALAGLGRYAGINNASLLNLYNASLAIGSTAVANRTGEQLAPTQNQNAAAAGSAATFGGIGVVTNHVNALRTAQADGGSGIATGESTGTWTGWTQVFGGDAHQGLIDSVSGYQASYSGLVLGADRSFGDAWRAGAAFTHSQTSVSGADNLAGSGSHVDAYGLIAYASYSTQPWYLNLSGSAVRNSYSSTRLISLTGDAAQGSYNGWQYVAKAEAGYPLALQGLTVTPLASLSYSRLKVNGYTETGSGAALTVQGSSQNSVRSGLGVRLEKSLQTGLGELSPFAQLVWSHQYNDSRMSTTASFAADSTGTTSFTTQGAAPTKDVAELSLGVNLIKSDDLTLSSRYDLQAARKYDAQTVSVRLQKKF